MWAHGYTGYHNHLTPTFEAYSRAEKVQWYFPVSLEIPYRLIRVQAHGVGLFVSSIQSPLLVS